MELLGIPPVILNTVADLLQPFCVEKLTPERLVAALEAYEEATELLTVQRFAARAEISVRTVYRAIASGKIVAYTVGNRNFRIPANQLFAYAKNSKETGNVRSDE